MFGFVVLRLLQGCRLPLLTKHLECVVVRIGLQKPFIPAPNDALPASWFADLLHSCCSWAHCKTFEHVTGLLLTSSFEFSPFILSSIVLPHMCPLVCLFFSFSVIFIFKWPFSLFLLSSLPLGLSVLLTLYSSCLWLYVISSCSYFFSHLSLNVIFY